MEIEQSLRDYAIVIQRALATEIEQLGQQMPQAEPQLLAAMRHSLLAGGKFMRAFLIKESAKLCGYEADNVSALAVAVEMLHCYSLVHDDLPAMDDDDYRRGQPTLHKLYDEATAILAGDCLLTHALGMLGEPRIHAEAEVRCLLLTELTKASGIGGMAAGQMRDMQLSRLQNDITSPLAEISLMERQKTGALFEFCAKAGAIIAKSSDAAKEALVAYARDFGLAFQIRDDLLDDEGDSHELGKAVAKDMVSGKHTFITCLGKEGARDYAYRLASQAKQSLALFGDKAQVLLDLADFAVMRRR